MRYNILFCNIFSDIKHSICQATETNIIYIILNIIYLRCVMMKIIHYGFPELPMVTGNKNLNWFDFTRNLSLDNPMLILSFFSLEFYFDPFVFKRRKKIRYCWLTLKLKPCLFLLLCRLIYLRNKCMFNFNNWRNQSMFKTNFLNICFYFNRDKMCNIVLSFRFYKEAFWEICIRSLKVVIVDCVIYFLPGLFIVCLFRNHQCFL